MKPWWIEPEPLRKARERTSVNKALDDARRRARRKAEEIDRQLRDALPKMPPRPRD